MICPNYNTPDFKAWEKRLGTFDTVRLWMLYDGSLPDSTILDFEDPNLGIPNLPVGIQKRYAKVLHVKENNFTPGIPGFSSTEVEEVFNSLNGVALYNFSINPTLLSSRDHNVLAESMMSSLAYFKNSLDDPENIITDYAEKIQALGYTQEQINTAERNRAKLKAILETPEGRATVFTSYDRYLDSLKNIISIDTTKNADNTDSKSNGETEVQGRNQVDWKDSNTVSVKDNAPSEVKLVLAGLLEMTPDGQNVFNTSFLLPSTIDPNSMFNYLLNNINLVKFDKASLIAAIRDLATKKPALKDLTNAKNRDGIFDRFDKTFAATNLVTKFIQTFAKTRPEHILNLLKKGGSIYTIDSTNVGIAKQITEEWKGNMLLLHSNTGTKLTPELIKKLKGYIAANLTTKDPIKNAQTLTAAYKLLGIQFKYNDIEDYRLKNVNIPGTPRMSREQALIDKVNNYLQSNQDFYTTNVGVINALAESDAKQRDDIIELQYINADGEVVYASTLNGFFNIVFDRISNINTTFADNEEDRLEMLRLELPWLYTLGNQHSIVRKYAEEGKTFQVNIQGGIDIDAALSSEAGVHFKKLSFVDRYAAMTTNILQGSYSYVRAGDRGLESGFSIMDGNNKMNLLSQQGARTEYVDYMIGYLKDELNTSKALVQNKLGADIRYYKDNAQDLRIFKGILATLPNPVLKQNIYDFIHDEKLKMSADDFVKKNFNSIDKAIRGWLNNSLKAEMEQLSKNLVINSDGKLNSQVHSGISAEILAKYDGSISSLMEDYFMNQSLAYMESIKVITGDLAFYAIKGGNPIGDYVKRVAMFNGTKEISRVDDEFNDFLDAHFKRQDLKSGPSRDIIKSFVVADVEDTLGEKLLAKYKKVLVTSYKSLGFTQAQSETKADLVVKAYSKINTTDAQGWVSLDEYREIKLRGGHWSDLAEEAYQKLIKGEKIADKDMVYFHPLKTQYAGPEMDSLNAEEENNRLYVPTGYKHSLFPLLPSLVDRNIEPLMTYMKENQIGIVQFDSATKVGVRLNSENEINPLYVNEEINLNNIVTQSIDYRFFGVQVQFEGNPKTEITDASQIRKNLLTNLVNQPEHADLITDYIETVNKIILDPLERVLDKIRGENLNNQFTFNDRTELVAMLLKQARSLNASDNVMLSTELLLNNEVFIDALASGGRVGQILLAHFRNKSTSGKRTGTAKVQVSSEALTFKKSESGVKDYLKFYDLSSNGTVLRMEVEVAAPKEWMPWILKQFGSLKKFNEEVTEVNNQYRAFHEVAENAGKEFLNKGAKLDVRLLQAIGYRIPNQAVASSDAIIIRRFLAPEFGDSIFIPNGITTKTGSDFDIDKLNLYLATTINYKGEPQYLNPENKDAFVAARQEAKEKLLNSIDKFVNDEISGLFPLAEISSKEAQLKDFLHDSLYDRILNEETVWTKEKLTDLRAEIVEAGKTEFQLERSTTLNHMLELEGKILTSYSNFHQLINPIDATLLKDLATKLKVDVSVIGYDDMIKTYYNVITGKYFLSGKVNIGIVAKHLTNNVVCQLAKIYINKEDSEADLYFKHNTIKIDGKIYPSLSNPQSITKEYISDYIQQFLSAYVDIAKEPFIFHLNAGTETINTILYMIRLGADPTWVAHFMTQPVLRDYIQFKENYDSKAIKAAANFKRKDGAAKAFYKRRFNQNFNGSRPVKNNADIRRAYSVAFELGEEPNIKTTSLEAQAAWRQKQLDIIQKYNPTQTYPSVSDFETRQDDKAFQEMIFDQYLEYNDQANYLRDFVQVTSPDTDSYQSLDAMVEMFANRLSVENTGFFGNFENVFSDPDSNAPTLMGTFVTAHEKIKQTISELYLSQQGHIAPALNAFKISVTQSKFGLDKEKALKSINNTFIDFLMANADVKKFSSIALKHLFAKDNPNSLPKRFATIKNDRTHELVVSENRVLNLLLSDLTNRKQDNIKLLNKVINTFEERIITDAFRQIKAYSENLPADHPDRYLFENLIKFAYLQGGIATSPISWTHIIPAEDSNSFIIPLLLEGLQKSTTDPAFMDNFKLKAIQNDPSLVKSIYSYFDEDANEIVQQIYDYSKDGEEVYYDSEYLSYIKWEEDSSNDDMPSTSVKIFYKRGPIDPFNPNIVKFSVLPGIRVVGDGQRYRDLTVNNDLSEADYTTKEEENSPITNLNIPIKQEVIEQPIQNKEIKPKIDSSIDVPPTMGNIKPC